MPTQGGWNLLAGCITSVERKIRENSEKAHSPWCLGLGSSCLCLNLPTHTFLLSLQKGGGHLICKRWIRKSSAGGHGLIVKSFKLILLENEEGNL